MQLQMRPLFKDLSKEPQSRSSSAYQASHSLKIFGPKDSTFAAPMSSTFHNFQDNSSKIPEFGAHLMSSRVYDLWQSEMGNSNAVDAQCSHVEP